MQEEEQAQQLVLDPDVDMEAELDQVWDCLDEEIELGVESALVPPSGPSPDLLDATKEEGGSGEEARRGTPGVGRSPRGDPPDMREEAKKGGKHTTKMQKMKNSLNCGPDYGCGFYLPST